MQEGLEFDSGGVEVAGEHVAEGGEGGGVAAGDVAEEAEKAFDSAVTNAEPGALAVQGAGSGAPDAGRSAGMFDYRQGEITPLQTAVQESQQEQVFLA